MRNLCLAITLLILSSGCAVTQAQQVQNDWQTLTTDTDSGALAVARLSFWDIFNEKMVWHEKVGSNEELYDFDWGTYSEAEAKLDATNHTLARCWGGGSADNIGNHHSVSVQAGREHIGEVDEVLGISQAETWHDATGVVTVTAQKDGLADCVIRVEDFGPDKHRGIEPQIIHGLVIRASIAGTYVTYTWDPIMGWWHREGEVVRYDAELGYNVAEEIPEEFYSGWRGLPEQEFHWKTMVEETENLEIHCGINSEGWELFDSVLSDMTGSYSSTTDVWDIEAAVHKTIETIE